MAMGLKYEKVYVCKLPKINNNKKKTAQNKNGDGS